MKTEVEIGSFKGSPTLTIWELDEENRRSKYPLIGFGVKKAKELLTHLEAIQQFVQSNEKTNEN